MRNVLLPADIRFDVAPDELAEDRMKVELRFFLPKDAMRQLCYAKS